MPRLPFSLFKQGENEYEVKDAQARNDIARLGGTVKLVMFGDSWLEGGGWGTTLANCLHASESHNYGVGGAGFARTGYTSFNDELTTANADLTSAEKDAITHVVIGGGINDQWDNDSDLTSAVQTFFPRVRTIFPNAKIYYFANLGDLTMTFSYYAKLQIIKNWATLAGCIVLDDLEYIMQGAPSSFIQNDHNHPTALGYSVVAQAVFNAMNGNHYDYLSSGSYDNGTIVHSRYTRVGRTVNWNLKLTPSSAGDITNGMTVGSIPMGYKSGTISALSVPLIRGDSGAIVGLVAIYNTACQIWNVTSGLNSVCFANASIDLVGALDH